MSRIRACVGCAAEIDITDAPIDGRIRCPKCGKKMRVRRNPSDIAPNEADESGFDKDASVQKRRPHRRMSEEAQRILSADSGLRDFESDNWESGSFDESARGIAGRSGSQASIDTLIASPSSTMVHKTDRESQNESRAQLRQRIFFGVLGLLALVLIAINVFL